MSCDSGGAGGNTVSAQLVLLGLSFSSRLPQHAGATSVIHAMTPDAPSPPASVPAPTSRDDSASYSHAGATPPPGHSFFGAEFDAAELKYTGWGEIWTDAAIDP